MATPESALLNIPTNLITGFLGAGKTSAILNLIEQKPSDQRWAVLVNEFGSVGIDGAIYKAHGIEVKEIPGGCMCCVAGVPLQVAVNQLLKRTRSQRLIIESSGLGHPKRVLDTLRGTHFQKVLDMRATICLLDPQKLLDTRYTRHENFIDQIAMADVLIANKMDLASKQALTEFYTLASNAIPVKEMVAKTRFGRLDAAWLDLPATLNRQAMFPAYHADKNISFPPVNDGYQSHGWRYPDSAIFDFETLTQLLKHLQPERIKAVIQTDKGWYIFNAQQAQFVTQQTEASTDSRLEMINPTLSIEEIQQQIEACMIE